MNIRAILLVILVVILAGPLALRTVSSASADSGDHGKGSDHGIKGSGGPASLVATSFFDTKDRVENDRAHNQASRYSPRTSNLTSHGGAVMHTTNLYLIFWGWGTSDPAYNYVTNFFAAAAGTPWLNSVTQYCDGVAYGTVNCGAAGVHVQNLVGANVHVLSDSSPVPTSPTQNQIAQVAANAAATQGYGSTNLYVVLTPTGHSQSGFGTQWCGYHGSASVGGNLFAYAYVPYQPDAGRGCGQNFVNGGSAGVYDGYGIVGGHELAEAMTDVFLQAWYDRSGGENGDKCAWSPASRDLPGTTFAVQPLWSNTNSGCVTAY